MAPHPDRLAPMTSAELKAIFWNWVYGAEWENCPVDVDVSVRISRDAEDEDPRHVAHAEELDDGTVEIVLSPRLKTMPLDNVHGVIAHELGHAIDYLYDFDLSERDHELRADAIAERVFDVQVNYDEDMIQTLGPGIRRPRGLR